MSAPPTILVAVLDSSALVSRWSRVVLQRLAALPHAQYVPVWSEWIIAETWRILAWRWLNRAAHPDEFEWTSLTRAANEMLRFLLPVMRLVSLRDYAGADTWPELTDRDDVPIWQTAVIAGATYVVSQNVNDFPPLENGRHAYRGIEYVTSIEFIQDVLGEYAEDVYGLPLPIDAAVARSSRTG